MRKAKILISLFLVVVFSASLVVPFSAKYWYDFQITSLNSGDYVMVVKSVTPPYAHTGDYFISMELGNYQGFTCERYGRNEDASYWRITRVSSKKCTIQNLDLGDNGYLNIGKNSLSYGPRQEIYYMWTSEDYCKFYTTIDGEKYYIRLGGNEDGDFQSSTIDDKRGWFRLTARVMSPYFSSDEPQQEPLLTLACATDGHVDFGLQKSSPYIRQSIIDAMQLISEKENPDLILMGGDQISNLRGTTKLDEWSPATYQRVVDAYAQAVGSAVDSNRSLWACGEHDCEVGKNNEYDSYAGFVELMEKNCGKPLAVYRQKEDPTVCNDSMEDYIQDFVMGLHYNIEGFDFIILNAPYMENETLSKGTIEWFEKRMKTIGASKTVFLLCHYPLSDSDGTANVSSGIKGTTLTNFKKVLLQYPNLIYLYGHRHDGFFAQTGVWADVFEHITPYNELGKAIYVRSAIPNSFTACFMGSLGYYSFVGPTLKDSENVQVLMIYVYKDRIVFEMKDITSGGKYNLQAWVLPRDVEGSLKNVSSQSPDSPVTDFGSGNSSHTETTDTTSQTSDSISQSTNSISQSTNSVSDLSSGTESQLHNFEEASSLSQEVWIAIVIGSTVLICGGIIGVGILISKKRTKG